MTIEAKRSRFRRSGPSGRVQCFRLASGAQAVMLFRSRQALTHAYQTKGSESLGSTAPVKQTVSYLRVSSKDQQREGYSIPAQRKLLQEYAQRHGFELAPNSSTSKRPRALEESSLAKWSVSFSKARSPAPSWWRRLTGCRGTSATA